MAATGLDVFDKTVQTTNIWLDDLMGTLGISRHSAWHTLGAVLRALRDRLPLGLAAHLGAQLPLLIRGAYYDQWRPADQPMPLRTAEEFLALVELDFGKAPPVDPRDAVRAVLQTLVLRIDPPQVEKVLDALPKSIRELAVAPVGTEIAR